MSVKVLFSVRHNGKDYGTGSVIENINDADANRLINLGVAYRDVNQKTPSSHIEKKDKNPPLNDEGGGKSELPLTEEEEVTADLDEAYTLDELKERANEIELGFKSSISKKELISLIISTNRVDEFLDDDEA